MRTADLSLHGDARRETGLNLGARGREADGMASLMMAIVNTPPRAVAECRRDLPHGLAEVIHTMLAKRPEERPTAVEAAERLDRLYSTLSTRVDPGP